MEEYKNFQESSIWQKAHQLTLQIYENTKDFPKEETYSLTSQIRRSVISIEANIAEAFGRFHYLDKLNFYYNVRGSLEETKSHIITANDLGYVKNEKGLEIKNSLDELGRELNAIIKTLRNKKFNKVSSS